MNDCPNGDIRDLLPDLLAGRLNAEARRAVEAHVAGCADCRAELELLTGMRSILRRAPAVDASAIVAAIPPYRTPGRPGWARWRAAAAVLLLAGGTSVVVLARQGTVLRSPDPTVAVAPRPAGIPATAATDVRANATARASAEGSAQPAHELALGSVAASDLDDRELSTLLAELQSLDALPAADVAEPASAITPVSPTGTN